MTLALAAGVHLAQGADPLKSAECFQALEALQAQEAALLAAGQRNRKSQEAPGLPAVEALRKRAAHECLGSRADGTPILESAAQAPIAVSPVAPRSVVVPAVPVPVPPPIQLPPLRTVTLCDPSGCWASDGTRLGRVGSMLVGPSGVCTVQASVLSCR